jgi:hypothetical protein
MPNNVLMRILAVIFIFTCLWVSGFILQRTNSSSHSSDYSLENKGKWVLLLGLRPGKGRVYIRFAFVQLVAILFLLVGVTIVVCCGEALSLLFKWLVIVFGLGALIFIVLDIFFKPKQ